MNVSAASHLSAYQVQQQVSTAVAKKSLDTAKQQGQAAVSMLQDAAQMQKQMLAGSHRLDVVG